MATSNFRIMNNFVLVVTNDCDDPFICDLIVEEMTAAIEKLNDTLIFHKISVKSGYYEGLQYYVECEHELEKYEYDNDDCWYYFDMCKSAAYKKYRAEINRINKELKKIASMHDYEILKEVGKFSDGTAIYTRAC